MEKFYFFNSFLDTARAIEDEKLRLEYMMAVAEYGIEGKESDNPIIKALMVQTKFTLDRSKEISENASERGRQGGAPQGNKNACKNWENNLKQPKTSKNNLKQPKTSEVEVEEEYKEIGDNKLSHKESESCLTSLSDKQSNICRGEMINGMEIPNEMVDKYGYSMLEDFTLYRSECDRKGIPKRQLQKTWSLGGRLATRKKNAETNFGRTKTYSIQDYENDIGLFWNDMKRDYQGIKQKVGIKKFTELSEKARHRAFENKVL